MVITERTQGEQIALLRAAIDRSGLSDRRFARLILTRDERTIRRWLSGERAIPAVMLNSKWLASPIPPDLLDWLLER